MGEIPETVRNWKGKMAIAGSNPASLIGYNGSGSPCNNLRAYVKEKYNP